MSMEGKYELGYGLSNGTITVDLGVTVDLETGSKVTKSV
mgnify:CR=1 FL=1